ncbi:4-hydroxy-3-methylbut-2-en-1-yl diphosphate synthase (flavodoxin) [Alphaproteobacteria bacterium]
MGIMLLLYKRHKTHLVKVGAVNIGGGAPIVVQSMTDTDTADVNATTEQIIELVDAGSEMVRITVNNLGAAKAVSLIKEKLYTRGYASVPMVGCFHYNGHQLLTSVPECAQALDKYRINPGNVGFGEKRDRYFETIVETAIVNNKPIRIGANWGSVDREIQAQLMDENSKLINPASSVDVMRKAIIESTLISAKKAEDVGLKKNCIVISAKISQVQDLILVYKELARRSNYAIHLGLTEAGTGIKGIVATASALSILLQQGIGDTIRASITPKPGVKRAQEVFICQEVLQSLNLRNFKPSITSCPGCGRTDSSYFRELAEEVQTYLNNSLKEWRLKYQGIENLKIAIMGCIVNGPGESKHADIGISLPGRGEEKIVTVFINGEKKYVLRGENLSKELKAIIAEYIAQRFA